VGTNSYKDDDLRTSNSNPEAFRDAQSIHGYSKWMSHYGEHKEFQLTPYANVSHMEFLQHFVPTAPLEKNGHESMGLNARFSYPLFSIPIDSVAMNSGFNLETARAYVDEYQSSPTTGNPLFGLYTQGQHYDFDV